ncbi:MAG TPA: M1 family metallopeptidase [Rhodothermales bacterium]|nr:M1 family metallopeptidase [Rhodothermales bacterium]
MRHFPYFLVAACLMTGCGNQDVHAQPDPYVSGGILSPEQAAFDVTFYDLALRINPADSSIRGALMATVRIVSPTKWLVLDLDPVLEVDSVSLVDFEGEQGLRYQRRGGRLWIDLLVTRQPQSEISVKVAYGGRPRVAPRPPWDGGFTWARTASGEPWIATSCQTIGADVWWPVKDHPSDEPDSMALHFTVPRPLVAASNGRLESVVPEGAGWRTYNWFISTPINVYNVALNAAPYELIEDSHESVAGGAFPIEFYVLPEDYEKGLEFLPEIHAHLKFFEEHFGPYPFRADKYGVAQTPHLGMEHQSIIAYGANFSNTSMTGRDWGFDALHHHELSHEWWGNMVTNVNWNDMWIHEGFGSYTQALYVEELEGMDGYHEYMNNMRGGIRNQKPVAPREPWNSMEIYGGDIYSKGAWVLHSLRFLIGHETMARLLRRMAYPDPSMEKITDGSHCRFVTTDDFLYMAEAIADRDLDWFFEVYLRQPDLPELNVQREGTRMHLRWVTANNLPFPMPLEIAVDGEIRRVSMPGGRATIIIPEEAQVTADPNKWVLRVISD